MLQEVARRADRIDASHANTPIDTLLFDFGGTLDANGIAWKERFYALYRDEGLAISPEAFQPCFFAADDALVGGLPPDTNFIETVHALTANLEVEFARHGGSNAGRGRSVASRFIADTTGAIERNRPVLEALSARYRLGIVSNFYGNLDAVCRSVGLGSIFSVMIDSQCVGVEKPDPAIFRVALDALRSTPETTVFVGDSLRRDREGARRTGMRFVWLQGEQAEPAETSTPVDHAIRDLRELVPVLA
jgi:FMN hydrolase / 5-amino-6-(5-phospho-D-ribitylamino)uracil phosphatase